MANIGIDLGTTHSLVATVFAGKARCLLDGGQRALVPSAVRYDTTGVPRAVGEAALTAASDPDGITFTSVKRFMGRSPADVADEAALFHYPLAEDERVIRFTVGEREITPVEISSFVLRFLHARAEEVLLGRPGGAVITVPAYFDDAQRQATRDAARIAGITVLRLLAEPTAAALAYGLERCAEGQRVVVYDLGGGTFDVSILELHEGVFQVLSTAGDTHLGGDDFDRALAGLLREQAGLGALSGISARALVRAAQVAKEALSDTETTTLKVELDGRRIEAGLDRGTFERLIHPLIARTGAACRQALSDAGLTPEDIDEVVLVGGSTRVPAVRAYVGELFGRAPHTGLDPDQVVALGAAIQADILSGNSETDTLLVDVVPLSLGMETVGGVVERIIPRTSAIPATATQTFTTHVDGQTGVDIHVVQGERELVRDCRSLARFTLSGLPPMAAGVPRVRVEFTVDADGILRVAATEELTATTAAIDVQPSYGLSDDEIEQMLDDAIDNAEDDIDTRLLIEARVQGEQILGHITAAMQADAALLEGDEQAHFQAVADDLKAALSSSDRQRILQLGERLDEITAGFAQRRIERDLALAIGGKAAAEVAEKLGLSPS